MLTHRPTVSDSRNCRGFTLIELLTVVVILGILAAVAIGGYMRNVKSAHKTEVIADLSNLSLREANFLAVTGHYASTTNAEDTVYPPLADIGASEYVWQIGDAGYHMDATSDVEFFRGAAGVHGFDALRFMPEGGQSLCGYGVISGWGSNAEAGSDDEPPASTIANAIFPGGTERYYARDWYYAFALCDFDDDDIYWAFTTAHYSSDVSSSDIGTTYREGE